MSKTKVSPGTWVERDLFESKAFMALKGFAPQLLIILLGKRRFTVIGKKGHEKRNCLNCGSIIFTYIEAEKKYGVSKPRLTRAFDELLAKGFLTIKYQGGGYKQDKSIYGLVEKWRLWRPGMTLEQRKKELLQRGYRKPNKKSNVTYINVPLHSHENVPLRSALG